MVTTSHPYPSVVDQLVERIFQGILNGDYPPGSRITELQLVEKLGASRTPIREAIRRLNELGLVIIKPRCGVEVASVGERDMQEIRALRAELETFALRQAMQHIREEDLEVLEQLHDDCEDRLEGGSRLDVFRQDSAFHLAIAQLAGNTYLYDALNRLDAKVMLCRMVLCRQPDKIRGTVGFHRTILQAMRDRDTDRAVSLLREHIENTDI